MVTIEKKRGRVDGPQETRTTDMSALRSVLVVDAPEADQILSSSPRERSVIYTHWRSLNRAMLARISPQAILAPLICMSFDVVDLGATLQTLGFQGDLYVITRPLPRAELVLQEVSAVCPGLNVHLVELA